METPTRPAALEGVVDVDGLKVVVVLGVVNVVAPVVVAVGVVRVGLVPAEVGELVGGVVPVTGGVEVPDGVDVPGVPEGDVAGVDEPAEVDEPDKVVAGVDEPPPGVVPVMPVRLWRNCVSQGAWMM